MSPSTDEEQRGSFKRWFVSKYFNWVTRRAEATADRNKELQLKTGRTLQRVIRIVIYEKNYKKRQLVPQEHWTYYCQAVDGKVNWFRHVPDTYDVTVITDASTLYSISKGEINRKMEDGAWRILRPFKPTDAVRMGLLEVDGPGSALRDLLLLEKEIFPQIAKDLKLPSAVYQPDGAAARTA